jgi:hypothetical protein
LFPSFPYEAERTRGTRKNFQKLTLKFSAENPDIVYESGIRVFSFPRIGPDTKKQVRLFLINKTRVSAGRSPGAGAELISAKAIKASIKKIDWQGCRLKKIHGGIKNAYQSQPDGNQHP